MKRLSFITQFKIGFLLPFTGCRKVFGKMPEYEIHMFNVSDNNSEYENVIKQNVDI